MRIIGKTLAVGTIALGFALTSTSAYASGPDVTGYAFDMGTAAGHATFKTYGDNLYITDDASDGHSVVAIVEQGSQSYYWNRTGKGTTRHVDLDLHENGAVALRVCLADWQGTPAGGIRWDTCGTVKETEA
ncbi:hypothetical protein ABZ851_09465 [Streptomyces sp. NPDC047049]|uniref:hypothetical protein n=1 Tax=Streptomyces sp. NPDC047049 TaxID=3156688 RepID=UPI0033CA8A3E